MRKPYFGTSHRESLRINPHERMESRQMTHNERLAVQLGLGAVLLWSTVASAFSLTLDHLSPLQLVALATTISWCFFVNQADATHSS